jgi:hypothetical protein
MTLSIEMLASLIHDDATLARVVRALVAPPQAPPAPAVPANIAQEPLRLVTSSAGRSHGKTFDDAFGKALAAAVRANGGRVQWTSRHIMEHVPGYRGNTARAIGNAMGQWARAWKAGSTTFYGLRVVDVTFNQRVDARASAVYTIESVVAAKVG